MIQSMTGFGKATLEYGNKKIVVEVKSLNSKQIDISTRISSLYREKDIEIRNEISQRLERGKIDFALYIDNSTKESATIINQPVVESYYQQIKSVSERLGVPTPDNWFEVLLRMPDTLKTESQELDENEWFEILRTIRAAIEQLQEFRAQEGKALRAVFESKINSIKNLLEQVAPFEAERVEKIKSRLEENLQSLSEKIDYDKNRLEQELIFYIEKLDVNEEKVRLCNHLDYFLETMDFEKSPGKKLGFIAQEIGREINTLGSKANHSEMQKIVILMKDELEQIKEQVLNVL
ncbi:YicC family protein [Paludibacter sp. 221]|uniref:YicC/YloC family endoribonuclease n=1 Tax=Paludibacter sp. 221 TaxID=2302939 RepID=UPI0013D882CA|nr:YicC/YloC family endoribonuclease [Paludibacter sp. 221]NDV46385.1 YicC family protein [Paludibacter sp. 221]